MESPHLDYTAELLRHFADLRDGTHGGAVSRRDKESFFTAAVPLLDPYARQSLGEINTDLLLGTGEVTATGIRRHGDGIEAIWALSWPEQQDAGISPIIIRAYYGAGAHHPHLQGGTVGDWPLNVFDERQAAAELRVLRAVASADLHNLVFQRDYRIIPAIVNGWAPRLLSRTNGAESAFAQQTAARDARVQVAPQVCHDSGEAIGIHAVHEMRPRSMTGRQRIAARRQRAPEHVAARCTPRRTMSTRHWQDVEPALLPSVDLRSRLIHASASIGVI